MKDLGDMPKKRRLSQELDYYVDRDEKLKKKSGLSPAFLRPPYQYTKLENNTVERYHEDDWMK